MTMTPPFLTAFREDALEEFAGGFYCGSGILPLVFFKAAGRRFYISYSDGLCATAR